MRASSAPLNSDHALLEEVKVTDAGIGLFGLRTFTKPILFEQDNTNGKDARAETRNYDTNQRLKTVSKKVPSPGEQFHDALTDPQIDTDSHSVGDVQEAVYDSRIAYSASDESYSPAVEDMDVHMGQIPEKQGLQVAHTGQHQVKAMPIESAFQQTINASPAKFTYTVREPIGVCGQIIP